MKIEGNRIIKSAAILAQTRSRTGGQFDQAVAAEDSKRVAQLAGVEYCYYNTARLGEKIELTFVVVERNLVRAMDFQGDKKYSDKTLRNKVAIKLGDYLDPIVVQSAKDLLIEFYKKKGFAFVEVSVDTEQLALGRLIYKIQAGPRVKISSVNFAGNKSFKARRLKRGLKTKTRQLLLWQGYYNEEKLTKDLVKLQNIYQKRGFLFKKGRKKVDITFIINEGPVYTVERIKIAGNEHFTSRQLKTRVKLKKGDAYSQTRAEMDAKRLLKDYHEVGFIDAGLEQKRRFISDSRVEVEFEIKEGQRFRIGRIDITGNQNTQDKVIRRVLDEYDFQPGQWYNADIARGDGRGSLEKFAQRAVMAESATITPSGETPGQKDALVSISEGQTGMVMLGAGLASDSGVIGQLVFEQRNFDAANWPGSFKEFITGKAFRGAGQNLRISLQPGTIVSEYLISFTEPYFNDKPIALDIAGSSYERGRESYDENRRKGYIGLERRYRNHWSRSIGFRTENVKVESIDFDAPREITLVKGDNLLMGVRLGIGRDLTDDRFNPSDGYIVSADYEQVDGDHSFGILTGTHRWYKSLHEDLAERKTILATKLHAGVTFGDAPPFEKFYAGGQGSIRGFDYRGVSTRGLQTGGVPNPEHEDPIGSDWIFLANAEVTVPLYSESLSWLFFIDSGTIDTGNYRVALGAGLQIMIPQWFGPVPMRFEFAAPLNKADGDETQVFSFSIGKLF
ncbi:MAG: outer membrane protein assembly factor BamA [Planctomycetota bacterium]